MYREIKSLLKNDAVFYSLVIIAVAIIAFGLGRLSVSQATPVGPESAVKSSPLRPFVPPIASTTPIPSSPSPQSQGAAVTEAAVAGDGSVIASKSGTKYHFPWCPGAKQIKEANRISFPNAAAARASGYTPAANCPGLE